MKTVMITGVSQGVGRALAVHLVQAGLRVIGVARTQAKLDRLREELDDNFISVCADVACDRDSIVAAVPVDVSELLLVHNAAVVEPMVSLAELKQDDFRHLLAVNFEAPLFLTQALLPRLAGGRVLHVSSGAAPLALPGLNPYCMSKLALERLSASWQSELDHIAFGVCSPGAVDTVMFDEIVKSEATAESTVNPADLLTPALVAKFLAWLLLETPADDFSTGVWDLYDTAHHKCWSAGARIVNPF